MSFRVPLEWAGRATMVYKYVQKGSGSKVSVTNVFRFIIQYLHIHVEASGFQNELFHNGSKLRLDKFTFDF